MYLVLDPAVLLILHCIVLPSPVSSTNELPVLNVIDSPLAEKLEQIIIKVRRKHAK